MTLTGLKRERVNVIGYTVSVIVIVTVVTNAISVGIRRLPLVLRERIFIIIDSVTVSVDVLVIANTIAVSVAHLGRVEWERILRV